MQGSLILSSRCPVKFLTFIVNGIIGNDKDHAYLGAYLDVQNKKLTLSNHLAVNSGVTASYVWAIDDLNMTEDCFFELPAKGLVKILKKLDNDKSVKIEFTSESSIDLANYVVSEGTQMTFGFADDLIQEFNSHHPVQYEAHIEQGEPYNYQQPSAKTYYSFRASVSTFRHLLKLVKGLAKQPDASTKKFGVLLRAQKYSDKTLLTIFAQKLDWMCRLPMEIKSLPQGDMQAISTYSASISVTHLPLLTGLLTAEHGEITVDFREDDIVLRKDGQWQCTFAQVEDILECHPLLYDRESLDSDMFIPLAVRQLLNVLPELNIADYELKTRLFFKSCPDSSATSLSVNQDYVVSQLKLALPISASVLKAPISLNLFALREVLSSFKDSHSVVWGVDVTRRRLIFKDSQNQHYVELALGCLEHR